MVDLRKKNRQSQFTDTKWKIKKRSMYISLISKKTFDGYSTESEINRESNFYPKVSKRISKQKIIKKKHKIEIKFGRKFQKVLERLKILKINTKCGKGKNKRHSRKSKSVSKDNVLDLTKPSTKPPPLKNIGANCYLNSALQGISSCKKLAEDIEILNKRYDSNVEQLVLLNDLIHILNNSQSDSKMDISNNSIFKLWNKPGQQDSFELLAHILNQVYNSIKTHKENNNQIKKIDVTEWLKEILPMRIIFEYEIVCDCGYALNLPYQSDFALHLPIPSNGEQSLQNLIEQFFKDDPIIDYSCYSSSCKDKRAVRKTKLLKPLPRTICIHLQKASWNGIKLVKIKNKINFTEQLQIQSKFISTPQNTDVDINSKENKNDLIPILEKVLDKNDSNNKLDIIILKNNEKDFNNNMNDNAKPEILNNDSQNDISNKSDLKHKFSSEEKNVVLKKNVTSSDNDFRLAKYLSEQRDENQFPSTELIEIKLNKTDSSLDNLFNKNSNSNIVIDDQSLKTNTNFSDIKARSNCKSNKTYMYRKTTFYAPKNIITNEHSYKNYHSDDDCSVIKENENLKSFPKSTTSNFLFHPNDVISKSNNRTVIIDNRNIEKKKDKSKRFQFIETEFNSNDVCNLLNPSSNDTIKESGKSIEIHNQMVDNNISEYEISNGSKSYILVAVIVHKGSLNGGHYICYKKFNDRWFFTDDFIIEEVPLEDIFNCEAYILFYEEL